MTRRAAAILLILLGAAVVATVLLTSPRVAVTGRRRGLSFLRVTPAPAPVTMTTFPFHSAVADGNDTVTVLSTSVAATVVGPRSTDEHEG